MKHTSMKFSRTHQEFDRTLNQRVRTYFEEKDISRYGNMSVYIKSLLLVFLWITPFAVHFEYTFPILVTLALGIVSGLAKAGINMGTMHDAMHGSYHRNKFVNKIVGQGILMLSGGYPRNWIKQHNVNHHTFTNVSGYDEDIGSELFRFAQARGHKHAHRYQHIYARFAYPLMTLLWITSKDWVQLGKHLRAENADWNLWRNEFYKLYASKILYYAVWIVLPIVYWQSVGTVLVFFFTMHLVCGHVLSNIFQMAHALPETDVYQDGDDLSSFASHQLKTTANFAMGNALLTAYCGGLNHQIEHHLFMRYCHVHYPEISKIVRKTAHEFGLPYHMHTRYADAQKSHIEHLKTLGNPA